VPSVSNFLPDEGHDARVRSAVENECPILGCGRHEPSAEELLHARPESRLHRIRATDE
jgi:hypothetical protein